MESSNSTSNSTVSAAVTAKIVTGFGMLTATFLMTIIPAAILRKTAHVQVHTYRNIGRESRLVTWRNHMLSAFNCFAAGVFVSAGLLHIFVDADEDVKRGLRAYQIKTEFPLAIFVMLCGVFIMLAIEQFVNFVIEQRRKMVAHFCYCYCYYKESRCRLRNRRQCQIQMAQSADAEANASSVAEVDVINGSGSPGDVHDEIIDPHSPIQSIILVTALSIHSVFEGLAMGLQHTPKEVYKIFLVIMLHKLAIAFSMGINLAQVQMKYWFMFTIALTFAIASPIGAFLGIGVMRAYDPTQGLAVGVLQAMACGTFVYVTFFEILPTEFHKKNCIRSLCLFGLLTGFMSVALHTFFMGHGHGHQHNQGGSKTVR